MTNLNYNPTNVATLVVFKPGVTEKAAKEALKTLNDLLEPEMNPPRSVIFDADWGWPTIYFP